MANKALTPRLNRMEPNIVIDGGHEIWPEGTSRSVTSGAQLYGSVLFRCANVSSGITLTNSQQSSIPSGTNIPYSNQVSKTAAGTLAAGTNTNLSYLIEGYDTNKILNDSFSLIFWVKSSVASNRSIALLNASQSHTMIKQYNIAAANTWQLQVVTFSGISACPGTIERTNLAGLQIAFTIVAGSTFQTATTGSWVAGNFRSGVGEDTTWLTGTTHDFSIAGVMVLPGDWSSLTSNTSAYKFQRSGRNYQEELQKSQRYWEGFPNGVSAGIVGYNGTGGAITASCHFVFKTEKRASPTITVGTGAVLQVGTFGVVTIQNGIGSGATYNPSQIYADSRF